MGIMSPGIGVCQPSPPAIRWSGGSRWPWHKSGTPVKHPRRVVRPVNARTRPANAQPAADDFWVVLGLDRASSRRRARRGNDAPCRQ